MKKVTATAEFNIPDGYDFVRYGTPEVGDYYINSMSSTLEVCYHSFNCGRSYQRVIVKKSELKFRDLKTGDIFTIETFKNSEFVKCSTDLNIVDYDYCPCRIDNHIILIHKDTTVKKLN